MSFVLPEFNLAVNIGPLANVVLNPRVRTFGNLALGRRSSLAPGYSFSDGVVHGCMWLLLPKLTDIRDDLNAEAADAVEVPAGSGRVYVVEMVDDIGKGFNNEHRFALLTKSAPFGGNSWPTPIP